MTPGLIDESEDFSTPPSSPATSRRSSIQSQADDDQAEIEGDFESKQSDQHDDPQLGINFSLEIILLFKVSYNA